MTRDDIQRYCQFVQDRVMRENEPVFIERRFEAAKDEGRFSLEVLPYRDIFADREAALEKLLSKPRLVILGEPGSGKSTVLREAARRLAVLQSSTQLPIFLSLRSYRGSIRESAAADGAAEAFAADGASRVYLMGGLDEIAPQQRAQFTAELNQLLADS